MKLNGIERRKDEKENGGSSRGGRNKRNKKRHGIHILKDVTEGFYPSY